mmetsp:Transcript_121825/g.191228  ORF Transcript_121825/g.191228 Transcript_121825/m.191228 type:complete len:139 (-) Transcript_121825:34-450(-)
MAQARGGGGGPRGGPPPHQLPNVMPDGTRMSHLQYARSVGKETPHAKAAREKKESEQHRPFVLTSAFFTVQMLVVVGLIWWAWKLIQKGKRLERERHSRERSKEYESATSTNDSSRDTDDSEHMHRADDAGADERKTK